MSSDQISDSESAEQEIATQKPLVEQNTASKSNSEIVPDRNEREQESTVERLDREKMITRRTMLIKAGWAVPVILAAQMSKVVGAGSFHDRHTDHVHVDRVGIHDDTCFPNSTHSDAHSGFHNDDCEMAAHADVTHCDNDPKCQ
jgi:hypothetical protein